MTLGHFPLNMIKISDMEALCFNYHERWTKCGKKKQQRRRMKSKAQEERHVIKMKHQAKKILNSVNTRCGAVLFAQWSFDDFSFYLAIGGLTPARVALFFSL